MAYLKHISTPQCWTCGKPATKMLYGWRNELYAHYCTKCAGPALVKLKEQERTETPA